MSFDSSQDVTLKRKFSSEEDDLLSSPSTVEKKKKKIPKPVPQEAETPKV